MPSPASSRRPARSKVVAAAAVALLACASVGVGAATHVRQAALARRSAYGVTWRSSQAATEAGRVVEQAGAALAGLDGVDADDVRARFDVLRNRVGLFDAPEYGGFLDLDPEAAAAARELRTAVARAEPLEGRLEEPDGLRDFRAALAPALGPASVLAGAAHRYGIAQAEADQGGIGALYEAFCALLAATGVGVALLVWTVLRQQATLWRLANHDPLTGLANRARLAAVLDDRLKRVGPRGSGTAVLYLDLDSFKPVNDGHGHAVGDALLQAVARRLEGTAGPDDLVARVGGDEFVVVSTEAVADALASRIVSALSKPFDVAGMELSIGTSVGMAIAPRDGETADRLLDAADVGLYRVKRAGPGRRGPGDGGMSRARAA